MLNISHVRRLYKRFDSDEMSLIYSGNFTDDLTSMIIDLNNYQFENAENANRVQRKTGYMIAECFQNIVRYNESPIINSYFQIKKDKGAFSIVSGNLIFNERIDDLKNSLEHLNELSKEELKEIYRKTLHNGKFSDQGGAGLGLIEMARKTNNKLNFKFKNLDDQYSYFYFQLLLFYDQQQSEVMADPAVLEEGISLRTQLMQENIFFVYKGLITSQVNLPILEMVKNTLNQPSQKKIFFILTELLQNISRHGAPLEKDHEGMVAMGKNGNQFVLSGLNYIYKNEVDRLKAIFERYTKADQTYLNQEYRRILKEGDSDNTKGASLGVIDMIRRSSKVEYEIQTADHEEFSIFTILLFLDL